MEKEARNKSSDPRRAGGAEREKKPICKRKDLGCMAVKENKEASGRNKGHYRNKQEAQH